LPEKLYDVWGGKNEIGFWDGIEFKWKSLIGEDLKKLNDIANENIFDINKNFNEIGRVGNMEIDTQLKIFFDSYTIANLIRTYIMDPHSVNDNDVFFEVEAKNTAKIVSYKKEKSKKVLIQLKKISKKIGGEKGWEKDKIGSFIERLITLRQDYRYKNLQFSLIKIKDNLQNENQNLLVRLENPNYPFIYLYVDFENNGIHDFRIGFIYNFSLFSKEILNKPLSRLLSNFISIDKITVLFVNKIADEVKSHIEKNEDILVSHAQKLILKAFVKK